MTLFKHKRPAVKRSGASLLLLAAFARMIPPALGQETTSVITPMAVHHGVLGSLQPEAYVEADGVRVPAPSGVDAKDSTSSPNSSVAAAFVDNRIVLYNLSGKPLRNSAILVHRVFAARDIPWFPQAIVNGVRVKTQANVKTRHADTSVARSYVAFLVSIPAGGSAIVQFLSQPLCNCEPQLAIPYQDLIGTMSPINARMTIAGARVTRGSVTVAAKQMLTEHGSLSTDPNSLGPRYTLTGPFVTRIDIEDRTAARKWDVPFSYPSVSNGVTKYRDVVALHPRFIITILGSERATRTEVIAENANSNDRMALPYSLSVAAGAGSYTNTAFRQEANTKWRKVFWSEGSGHPESLQAANIWTDYNFDYIIKSKAVLNYDRQRNVSDAMIRSAYESYPWGSQCSEAVSWLQIETDVRHAHRRDIGGIGQYCAEMPSPGGRGDLAVVPFWDLTFVQAMQRNTPESRRLLRPFIGNAEAIGALAVHWRENIHRTRAYLNGSSATAFGRFISLDTRPTVSTRFPSDASELDGVGWSEAGSPWPWIELAHVPGMAYMAALITGDDYFIEGIQAAASYGLTHSPYDSERFRNPYASAGYIEGEYRGQAWALRNLAQAAYLSPSGSVEAQYFRKYHARNIAIREGQLGTIGQHTTPCPATIERATTPSPYCWGWAQAGPRYKPSMNPMRVVLLDTDTPLWMVAYMVMALQHGAELGLTGSALANDINQCLLKLVMGPSPQIVSAYYVKMYDSSRNALRSPEAVIAANGPALTSSVRAWDSRYDAVHGYAVVAKGALSFLHGRVSGGLDGSQAWALIDAAVPTTQEHIDKPGFTIVPRSLPNALR